MKILNENKKYLEEGAWYKSNIPNYDYYAYFTDSTKYPIADKMTDILKDPVTWKNKTHELLNDTILDLFLTDAKNNKYPGWTKYNGPLPAYNNMITPTARDFRGKGAQYVDPSIIKQIIADYGLTDINDIDIYIHHLNEREPDLTSNNLISIPYNDGIVNLKEANIAHKIIHSIGNATAKYGAYSKDILYYFLDAAGHPLKRTIHIEII